MNGEIFDMAGYLFAHFTGERQQDEEQVYFSFSRDGLFWKDLNGGKPVLRSQTGENGARDPFLVRDKKREKYYLIATDLCIYAGKGWKTAQENGSRNLLVWESADLVHWSKVRSCEVAPENAGCVWAPEAVFDEEKDAFLVFWASKVRLEGENAGKHRIYASYTRDFREFTEPFLFLERPQDVIDSTIFFDDNTNGSGDSSEHAGVYYRFSKDETTSRLILEKSDTLAGSYTQIASEFLEQLQGVEGPECYRLPDGRWCLIVDRFREGKGYLPIFCEDLEHGRFCIVPEEAFDFGKNKKRHGGVLELNDEESERVWRAMGDKNPVLDGLYADPDLVKFGDTFYLYPTTDGFTDWTGTEFFVFSSEDGRHFKKEARVLDLASDEVPWAMGCAWAPCAAKKGNRYYFYFCGKRADGKSCIGAAWADSPVGPFHAQPEPMVTPEMVNERGFRISQAIDPSVYQEGEESYLVFGNGEPFLVKLTEDMLHVEPETMVHLDGAYDFRESMIITKRDNLYHFTWSCDDTRSENYHVNYGTAKALTGPIQFQYSILEKSGESLGTGHHSILKVSGTADTGNAGNTDNADDADKSSDINNTGDVNNTDNVNDANYTNHTDDVYYIAYHRFATPLKKYPEGKGFDREVCIAELKFGEDGKMKPVVVQDK